MHLIYEKKIFFIKIAKKIMELNRFQNWNCQN